MILEIMCVSVLYAWRRAFGHSPEHLAALLVYEIKMENFPQTFKSSAFKGIWVQSHQYQFSLRINCASLSETFQKVQVQVQVSELELDSVYLVLTSSWSKKKRIITLSCCSVSSLFLKAFTDSADTTFCGSSFHGVTTLKNVAEYMVYYIIL